jgi:DNA-binding CsgD family transcriptional regulator
MIGSVKADEAQDHVLDPGWNAADSAHADRLSELLIHANIHGCLARFAPVLLAQLVPAEHLHGLEIIGINEAGQLSRPSPLAIDGHLLPWVMNHVWGQAEGMSDLSQGRSIVRRGSQEFSALLCVPLFDADRLTALLACSVSAENEAHLTRIIQGMIRIGALCSSEHDGHCDTPGCASHDPEQSAELSPRQRLILEGMEQGLTNRQIATRIGFSESTVRMESMAIYRFFGVHSRTEAVAAAAVSRTDPQEAAASSLS